MAGNNPFDDLIPRPGAVPNVLTDDADPAFPTPPAGTRMVNPMVGTLVAEPVIDRVAQQTSGVPVPGGWEDPQQYAEAVKQVIPGAVSFAGSIAQGSSTMNSVEAMAKNVQPWVEELRRAPDMSPQQVADLRARIAKEPALATRTAMQSALSDILEGASPDKALAGYRPPVPVEQRSGYQVGEAVQNYAKGMIPPAPGYENSFGADFGRGVGSLAAGAGLSLFAGPWAAGSAFAGAGVGEATQRAVEFDRKEKAAGRPGITQDQITTAGLLGIGPGATDLLPVEVLLGRLPVRIPEYLRRPMAMAISRVGMQAIIEGVQEGGQGYLQDLIAREIYNPKQVLGENFQREAEVGAAVGGFADIVRQIGAGMVRSAAGRRGPSQTGQTSGAQQPTPQAPNLPQDGQDPQLPWPSAQSQESTPVATPEAAAPSRDRKGKADAAPTGTPANPFADLVPANQNQPIASAPWVGELAQAMAAKKAVGEPDSPRVTSHQTMQADPAQVQPRQPDTEPDILPSRGAQPSSVPAPAAAFQPMRVITPDGSMEIEARPEIVELDDLKLAQGALQPRDRSRASRLDPAQLQPSRVSDTGAPIVAADGTVLSGNGRTMSIEEAYTNRALEGIADSYRRSLGQAAEGMRRPVLIMRTQEMAPQEAVRFADLSNRGRIAQMSATERAVRDASSMGSEGIALYQGGDFTAPQNRRFIQDFVARVVTSAERPSVSRNGELTQEGAARMRGAILAAAYGDQDVLARMLESTDDNVRSITAGLLDAAPMMAQLRAGIASGEVAPDMDAVPALVAAIRTISDLRARRVPVQTWMAQTDAFGRDPVVEAWVKSFYYDDSNRAKRQEKIAALLNDYATEAIQHRPDGLFADETTASDVLGVARRKNDASEVSDLFAPDGSVGEGSRQAGRGAKGRANAAGGQGSGQGGTAESAVVRSTGDDILAAVQTAPSRLEYEARELLRDVRAFEASLRNENASPEVIAQSINERYGTEVTPDEIATGDVWWKSLPGEDAQARGFVSEAPEFVIENALSREAESTGNATAPIDLNARPATPQQVKGIQGAASSGPQLTPEMRQRATELAQQGKPPRQIANTLKGEFGRYVRTDQIEATVGALHREATDRLNQQRRQESRARQTEAQRARMSTPEAKAIQSARWREILARPEMQTWLKDRAQALNAARGNMAWTSAMVERLSDPVMRAKTGQEAADILKAEFGEVASGLTPNAVRQKRSALGYGYSGDRQFAASPFTADMESRLATPEYRAMSAESATAALHREFGDQAKRITATSVRNKRAVNDNMRSTRSGGRPSGFQWSATTDQRLATLMTEAANPTERARILSEEFGAELTPKAVQRRWEKIKSAVLRSQGDEPMFAAGGWDSNSWLEWIKGNPNAGREDTPASSGDEDSGSQQATGQQPGASQDRSGSDGSAGPRGKRGVSATFRVRDLVGRVVDAPPNFKGLSNKYVYLHGPKAYFPDRKPSTTLRILDSVPNWQAKAHASEVEPGVWQIQLFRVRKAKANQGLGTDFLDSVQQQLGEIRAPREMTEAAYQMWRAWELQGATRANASTSIDDYTEYKNKMYSPQALRIMQREAAYIGNNTALKVAERNDARRQYNELSDLIDRLPPEPEDDGPLFAIATASADYAPTPPTNRADYIDEKAYNRLIRDQYVDPNGTVKASSREVPLAANLPPVGSWRISGLKGIYGH